MVGRTTAAVRLNNIERATSRDRVDVGYSWHVGRIIVTRSTAGILHGGTQPAGWVRVQGTEEFHSRAVVNLTESAWNDCFGTRADVVVVPAAWRTWLPVRDDAG